MKQKYLRANQGRFMTITYIRQLWNVLYLQISFWAIGQNVSKRIQKTTKLLRKPLEKSQPFFSNKVKGKTPIKLVENDEMIDDEIEIAKPFNEYFVNIVKKLGLFSKEKSAISTENSLSEVEWK